MKYYKTIKPWALVAAWTVAAFFVVSQRALSETEVIQIYDYGTQTFSTETINRYNGQVDVQRFNYGTGNFSEYHGDSQGGQGYSYGSGTFTDVQGDPYGVGND
jgi:hypothetical protein